MISPIPGIRLGRSSFHLHVASDAYVWRLCALIGEMLANEPTGTYNAVLAWASKAERIGLLIESLPLDESSRAVKHLRMWQGRLASRLGEAYVSVSRSMYPHATLYLMRRRMARIGDLTRLKLAWALTVRLAAMYPALSDASSEIHDAQELLAMQLRLMRGRVYYWF